VTAKKVLHSVHLDQATDDALAARAGAERTTKGELIRRFVEEGLRAGPTDLAAIEAMLRAALDDHLTQLSELLVIGAPSSRRGPRSTRPKATTSRPPTSHRPGRRVVPAPPPPPAKKK
jgi:hypothetical protein